MRIGNAVWLGSIVWMRIGGKGDAYTLHGMHTMKPEAHTVSAGDDLLAVYSERWPIILQTFLVDFFLVD